MIDYMLAFVIALLVFGDQIIVGKADNECEVGYELFQESCYRLSDSTATRPEAVAACIPGHLADITSEEEHNFIDDLLTDNSVGYAWFGLLKSLSWSDGSPLVHESWQDIVADEGHRCFLLEQLFGYYRWNDIACDDDKAYQSICEYEITDSEECRPGFTSFNRSCYQFNDITLNRADAAAACNTSQAHLVDIDSDEEHQSVVGLLTDIGGGNAWLGLTLSDPPSWSDGSLLSPASWYDITTNGQSVCYRLQNQGPGRYRWDDAPSASCRDSYGYVCEYEVTSLSSSNKVPEYTTPSTSSMSISTISMTGAVIGLSLGIVVVVIIVVTIIAIVIIYFRRKSTTETCGENKLTDLKTITTTEPSQQDPDQIPDYQNVSNPDKSTGSETYIGLDRTSRQPEAVYQGMTDPKELKSTDDYLSLDVNSSSKTDDEYQSLSDNAMVGNKKTDQDLIYHEIAEKKEDQYDYAYVNPTEVSIPAVNPNMEVRHTYFRDPNKNAKDVYVNANIHVRKS